MPFLFLLVQLNVYTMIFIYIPLSWAADVTSSQSLPPDSRKHWTRIWILNDIRRSSSIDC